MSAKITLISMSMLVNSYNVRLISGSLRKAGFETTKILLPDIYPYSNAPAYNFAYTYENSIVADIVRLAHGSLWIGISVITNLYMRSVDLTRKLKERLAIPIVWGGVHVSAKPEECLQHADYIVLGEGEDTAVEISQALVSGRNPADVPGVGVLKDGNVSFSYRSVDQKTPIERLSWADYSLEDEWVQDKEARRLRKFDLNQFTMYSALGPSLGYGRGPVYFTGASRGCPYRCSYCVHSLLSRKFPEFMKLRIRPVDDLIAEMAYAKQHIPTIKGIITTDENFFALGDDWIAEFCKEYKKKVYLPFRLMCSVSNITRERIRLLVDAGMICIQVGIEGISDHMHEMYNRKWAKAELFQEKIKILNSFKPRLIVQYDVIMDNLEETEEEQRATLLMITHLPRPFRVQLFALTYFPGSILHEHAMKTGLITDELNQVYLKSHIHPRATYLAFLYLLIQYHFPLWLVRWLAAKFLFSTFRGDGFVHLMDGLRKAWHRLIGSESSPVIRPDPALLRQVLKR